MYAGIPPKVSSDDSVMHYAGACYAMTKDIESSLDNIQKKMHVLSRNRATLFGRPRSNIEREVSELESQFKLT